MDSPIVTLTTDWGDRDFFAALVKGRLCSMVDGVRIVDLSHSQSWNDNALTAGIIRHGCLAFPAGTVHLIDVGCEQLMRDGQRQQTAPLPLLASYGGHFFVCSDRRILEQSLDNPCDELVELTLPEGLPSYTFLASTLFCEVAAGVLSGRPVAQFGTPCEPLRRRSYLRAQQDGDILETMVIGIDNYGNANLNITYNEFKEICRNRRFRVELEWRAGCSERCEAISGVSKNYCDARMGDLLLTVSATGALQLAINKGSVAQLIGMRCASRCRFVFT